MVEHVVARLWSVGIPNPNGFTTTREAAEEALKRMQEDVQNRRFFGVAESAGEDRGIYGVVLEEAAFLIKDVRMVDDRIEGVVETLDTPRGRWLAELIGIHRKESGEVANIEFTLVATCDPKNKVVDKLVFICGLAKVGGNIIFIDENNKLVKEIRRISDVVYKNTDMKSVPEKIWMDGDWRDAEYVSCRLKTIEQARELARQWAEKIGKFADRCRVENIRMGDLPDMIKEIWRESSGSQRTTTVRDLRAMGARVPDGLDDDTEVYLDDVRADGVDKDTATAYCTAIFRAVPKIRIEFKLENVCNDIVVERREDENNGGAAACGNSNK